MTVGNILDTLVVDEDLYVSVQTRENGCINELYNNNQIFDKSYNVRHMPVNLIKIENHKLFIFV